MRKELVAGLIIKDDKILLVHNIKHGLRVEPPGGKIEPGETPESAVTRDLKEELGIRVRPVSLFGTYDTVSAEGEFSVKMYFCEIIDGEPRAQKAEENKINHFEWYSFDEIEQMKNEGVLAPNLVEALPRLREQFQEFRIR